MKIIKVLGLLINLPYAYSFLMLQQYSLNATSIRLMQVVVVVVEVKEVEAEMKDSIMERKEKIGTTN